MKTLVPQAIVTLKVTDVDGCVRYEEVTKNTVTYAGLSTLHRYCYGVDRPSGEGFNWMGLSEAVGDADPSYTNLAGELVQKGLRRRRVAVTLPSAGSAKYVTEISAMFTNETSDPVAVTMAALFDAEKGGSMAHLAKFIDPRTVYPNDTVTVSFSIEFDVKES